LERELKASVYDAATDYLRTGLLTPEVSLHHCHTLQRVFYSAVRVRGESVPGARTALALLLHYTTHANGRLSPEMVSAGDGLGMAVDLAGGAGAGAGPGGAGGGGGAPTQTGWRAYDNSDFQLCATYPRLLLVPDSVGDAQVRGTRTVL
jgi:hypothetical protein